MTTPWHEAFAADFRERLNTTYAEVLTGVYGITSGDIDPPMAVELEMREVALADIVARWIADMLSTEPPMTGTAGEDRAVCETCRETLTMPTRDAPASWAGWVGEAAFHYLNDFSDFCGGRAVPINESDLLDADTVAALDLDPTGRDGNPRFPYSEASLTDPERAALAVYRAKRDVFVTLHFRSYDTSHFWFEGGELIETVDTLPDGSPDWEGGAIVDPGMGDPGTQDAVRFLLRYMAGR